MIQKLLIMPKNIYNNITMKTTITFILLIFSALTFGQNNPKLEKIKALRVAFISTKLELTPDEAQKFWPIFNEFDEKQMKIRLEKKRVMLQLKPQNTTSLSETEVQKLLENSEILESNIQENRQLLVKNLKGVIPTKKIILLKELEEEFKKTLLKQIRNGRK